MTSSAAPAASDELPKVLRTASDRDARWLDRSIADVLDVVRVELAMSIVFVSRRFCADVVVSHASCDPTEADIRGTSHPFHQSLCQRVLDGRLPAVMPDVQALSETHDVPVTPLSPGAYMTAPIHLHGGNLYGLLCCMRRTASPELDDLHHQRLRMSARQIARLVEEAGER